ncbi:MAG: hypothetical protein B6U78_02275 [Candidatus Aenigmarchaeota archaeon ex4484_224]|nr:MAG: hypothetical protein B6U78_02275 [Candidatus Aenigmarchaeota archaeon ex4484_224]
MKIAFLYPNSPISPHKVHLAWALSIGAKPIKTPKGIGKFDVEKLKNFDILFLESLYCLPFASKAKKKNSDLKIVSLIADTSFYPEKLSLARRLYFKFSRLDLVDAYITISERIRKYIISYTGNRKVVVVRPFSELKFSKKEFNEKMKRGFEKKAGLIGNKYKVEGMRIVEKMSKDMKDWDFYLAGSGSNFFKNTKNLFVLGWVRNQKDFFKKISFYLHPIKIEPFSVSSLEAMRIGSFPLIYKEAGILEIVPKKVKQFIEVKKLNEREFEKKLKERFKDERKSKKILKELYKLSLKFRKEESVKEFKRKFWKLANS